ncbi:MAG: hypothetical protein M1823_004612 [Watsoniomyces obsoletus]|nr:MAG: hypothetical protein M1823_004612 [Watsoniomyces obsoletus]
MAEYIGSRITLYSRSDIRYVGTLFEIDAVNSTVSLEKVICFGTEGRRPDEEIPPSDTVYDYVIFRGSDVKDLSVLSPPPGQVQSPEASEPEPVQQAPTDPAILQWLDNVVEMDADEMQSGSRPAPASMTTQSQEPQVVQAAQAQTQPELESQTLVLAQSQLQSEPPQFPPPMTQGPGANYAHPAAMHMPVGYHPYYPQQHMGYPGMSGPHGHVPPPPGHAYPGMPPGPPPGWHPPPMGHPHANMGRPTMDGPPYFLPGPPPFAPPMPIGRQRGGHGPNMSRQEPQVTSGPPAAVVQPAAETDLVPKKTTPVVYYSPVLKPKVPAAVPTSQQQKAPTPPVESKPDPATALAPAVSGPSHVEETRNTTAINKKPSPMVPAVPIPVPNLGPKRAPAPTEPLQSHAGNVTSSAARKAQPSHEAANAALREATQAATAAVAAAMAKLPPAPGQTSKPQVHSAMDDLTKKLDNMRTGETSRPPPRHPSGSGPVRGGYRGGNISGGIGGRGGYRGGHYHGGPSAQSTTRKVDVPTEDYDFETANATFNKQDLIKEAIASGATLPTAPAAAADQPATNGTAESGEGSRERGVLPMPTYNKATSFFDNISSEAKEREAGGGPRRGGREWRGEEQKRNVETFGQGSVDTGYRGHYRGRGGRGRGFSRGRGGGSGGFGGRGSSRGGGGPGSSSGPGSGGRGRFRGDHQGGNAGGGTGGGGQPPRAPAVTATT